MNFNFKNILYIILIIAILIWAVIYFSNIQTDNLVVENNTNKQVENLTNTQSTLQQTTNTNSIIPVDDKKTETTPELEPEPVGIIDKIKEVFTPDPNKPVSKINIDVPFTSQAPFAEWDDPRQQDGCEEASLLMAWGWLEDKSFSKDEAKNEIINLYDYGVKMFGQSIDTSAEDSAKLFREYFKYENAKAVYDVDVQKIKDELILGNVVLVPTDGTKLKNPYYTPPGPERHMVVITGFNDKKKVFVVNDPGTKRGENFEYDYDVVINSIINYSSGDHAPLIDDKKVMIVIEQK